MKKGQVFFAQTVCIFETMVLSIITGYPSDTDVFLAQCSCQANMATV
jgi:hypothetical protein